MQCDWLGEELQIETGTLDQLLYNCGQILVRDNLTDRQVQHNVTP